MKSNFDVRPAIIQPLGNGAYHYNFNIVERTERVEPVQTDAEEGTDVIDTAPQTRTTYDCDTVVIWGVPTYDKVVKAVIREEIDETKEFSYVNDYNAAVLGVISDKQAVADAKAAYKEYLQFVVDVKAQVKADLQTAGY